MNRSLVWLKRCGRTKRQREHVCWCSRILVLSDSVPKLPLSHLTHRPLLKEASRKIQWRNMNPMVAVLALSDGI